MTVLNEMFVMQYVLYLRAIMQFVAIVDDKYARVTHFPDDDKATNGYL